MPRNLKKKGIPPEGLTFIKSQYTLMREKYLRKQSKIVENMLHHIVDITNCMYYRLRYPIFNLLKAVARKLLLNQYQCIVFGYLLSINKWNTNIPIILKHRFDFPEVIYVNDPTDQSQLRSLTLFLYLTCYSIKQYLNQDPTIYRNQMIRLYSNFAAVNTQWINSQQTTQLQLDPQKLNSFYKNICKPYVKPDYNQLVDEILHISPCYGIEKEIKSINQIVAEIPSNKQQMVHTHIQGLFPSHNQDILDNLGWSRIENDKDLI